MSLISRLTGAAKGTAIVGSKAGAAAGKTASKGVSIFKGGAKKVVNALTSNTAKKVVKYGLFGGIAGLLLYAAYRGFKDKYTPENALNATIQAL